MCISKIENMTNSFSTLCKKNEYKSWQKQKNSPV